MDPALHGGPGTSQPRLSVVTSARQAGRGEDAEGNQLWSGSGHAGNLDEITCADLFLSSSELVRWHTSGLSSPTCPPSFLSASQSLKQRLLSLCGWLFSKKPPHHIPFRRRHRGPHLVAGLLREAEPTGLSGPRCPPRASPAAFFFREL